MYTKKKNFEIPFIGYDYGNEHQWNFDVLIGEFGNPIIGIKIKNSVEQYSADPESYKRFHNVLNNVIAIIGENHIVQKLDIFSKKQYQAEHSKEFLQQKYSEHFEGRTFKCIETLLLFTDFVDERFKKKKSKQYDFSERNYKDLRDKCQKVFMLLQQNHCEPKFLFEKDFDYYISGILSMKFSEVPSFDNIKSTSDHLKIGKKLVKTISYVDLENIDLPSKVDAYSLLGGNSSASETTVDNFTFINELEDYQTIIYNQIISIPPQVQQQRDLEKKKKKHEGASSNAPSNLIIAQEIDTLLRHIAIDGQLIVNAHFSLVFSTHTVEELEKTESLIENKLFTKGIIVSKNAYNQLELFRCAIPGNAVELKDYDYFMTTSEAALCFFFKESYPVNENSNFYLRFTDRQGVPLKIDPTDLSMKTGRINNRNKFVLGPSGSGKSFLMNNIVEQYLTYNYDVVIVDTGDSYSGTCKYKNGKYIQYTDKKPITMNPFLVSKEEFNIEKVEFLANLIFLIWNGADKMMSATQKSILDNVLMSYYHQYFNGETKWYDNKTSEELILHLQKYNIHEEDIISGFENENNNTNYYEILEISSEASIQEIKDKGRKLIRLYHPDANINNPDYDSEKFYKVYEAYDILTDEEKRKAYNESQMILVKANEMIKRANKVEDWNDCYRKAIIERILKIEEELKVSELSFNSFYEYCERFLPIYLNNKKHRIEEREFNLRTFLFVLRDFYKSGRYGTTLNESADSTLFNEPFIVFEIDNVKDNPKLFPIVTLIIMDTFIQKMRLRKDRRKALIIEEAWKAIASKLMGGYILYLYKTVRKFWGEAIVVTQELDDIIGNTVVKDSIINNSDTFILLDQTKFKDNFDRIASLLSLNKVEQNKIFTINNLNNKFGRSRFKEFYLKRGSKGEVYGNEVALEQYLTYTTEKPEKSAVEYYVNYFGNYDVALQEFVKDLKQLNDGLENMVSLVNLYKKPLNEKVMNFYHTLKITYKANYVLRIIEQQLQDRNINLEELINSNIYNYESL